MALLWAATVGVVVGAVVLRGETAGWACAFFVLLLAPFAVGVLLMALSDRRSWAVAARGIPVEARSARGLGSGNSQGRQVLAWRDRDAQSLPYLHLTLPDGVEQGDITGPVTVEIFRRTGRGRGIGGPVRVRSSDGRREWWAGNAVESGERHPPVVEAQTSVT